MKKMLFAILMCVSMGAMATGYEPPKPSTQNVSVESESYAKSYSESEANASVTVGNTSAVGGTSESTSAGGSSSVSNSVNTPRTQTIRNVPSINAPALTSSNDTCAVSASGSLALAGFGVGGGKAYVDENCVMLKNAREMWNMGMKSAAMALMCSDENNRYALEVTGYHCPDTREENSWLSQLFGASKYKENE